MNSTPFEPATPRSRIERLGLLVGLVLFALVLSRPQAPGMVSAARNAVRDEVRSDITDRLRRDGLQPGTPGFQTRHNRELASASDYIDAEARRRAGRMVPAAAVTVLVAVLWMTEAIPIPATSLLPLLLFPMVGVLPLTESARRYADPAIFLYLGGFIIALGIERWGLHRRIALHVVHRIGTSRRRIVLAFMVATGGLSMWISNTATTLMMLPIALAVLRSLDEIEAEQTSVAGRTAFGGALMLGICYGASIGGVGTPIGTPTNIAFLGQFTTLFPNAPPITFARWAAAFVPLSVVFIIIAWWILTRITQRVPAGADAASRGTIDEHLAKLPPMSGPERWMAVVGLLTAALWMTRGSVRHAQTGWLLLVHRAWPDVLPANQIDTYINDTTVAVFMALLLFVLPGGRDPESRRTPLMDWSTAVRLPWGILLLFGGGFTIAHAFQYTGLSAWIGQLLAGIGWSQPLSWMLGATGLMTFLTEITSNTATTQVMLPVLKETALEVGVHPLALMLAATIASSCAFMLPVATPPNAIVFSSGQVSMRQMLRSGIVVNMVGIVLVTGFLWLWANRVLGIDPAVIPTWAGGSP